MTTDSAETDAPKKISPSVLKTSARYLDKMRKGARILRDANGRLQWADGKHVGAKTVQFMLSEGQIAELDTDLFGDRSHGQTIGAVS
jgi:hypothetical protein